MTSLVITVLASVAFAATFAFAPMEGRFALVLFSVLGGYLAWQKWGKR